MAGSETLELLTKPNFHDFEFREVQQKTQHHGKVVKSQIICVLIWLIPIPLLQKVVQSQVAS